KPSSAAARIPPWLPTSPPKRPESAPPARRQKDVEGRGRRRPASSLTPARSSSSASRIVSVLEPTKGLDRSAGEPTEGTRDTELPKRRPVHLGPETPAADGRGDRMGNRRDGDRS